MSGYHVYGVGNALVDMEYVVDADAVTALGLQKGVGMSPCSLLHLDPS